MATKKLQRELQLLHNKPVVGVSVVANEQNIFQWDVTLCGPAKSPYEGGVFRLRLETPDSYPFVAPKIKFQTRIFHPNVDEDGSICLEIIKADNWKPAVSMSQIFQAVIDLLITPLPDDALREEIGALYRDNLAQFQARAREETKKYASA